MRNKRALQHRQQPGVINAFEIAEVDHHKALVQRRDGFRRERVRGVHRRHALEVNVRAGELWREVVDVVFHGAHHRIHHRFARMAALAHVARQLLDPLQVHDRHHANQQIHMTRHVMLWGDYAAV